MFQIVFVGCFMSAMILNSCDSGKKQESYNSNPTETVEASADLSDCYETIKKLSKKMSEEGSAFYEKLHFDVRRDGEVVPVGNVSIYGITVLTDAYHADNYITHYLRSIDQGENVTANLQNIEQVCFDMERNCTNGIKELRNVDESRYSGWISIGEIKDSWISVLERIKNYSSEIREQVQVIRKSQ